MDAAVLLASHYRVDDYELAGLPAVVADRGPLADLVLAEAVVGVPADSPQRLATETLRLLTDIDAHRFAAAGGRRWCEQESAPAVGTVVLSRRAGHFSAHLRSPVLLLYCSKPSRPAGRRARVLLLTSRRNEKSARRLFHASCQKTFDPAADCRYDSLCGEVEEHDMREFLAITKALSDENRVRALMFLAGGELCVCQIIEMLGLAPSTVSKHMTVLHQARLVDFRKEGRWIHYRLADETAPPCAQQALEWVRNCLRNDPAIRRDAKHFQRIRKMDRNELSVCYKG